MPGNSVKSWLMLLGTFLLGGVLGGVVVGAVAQNRENDLKEMRRPGGFVEHMEQIIQPSDEEQRSALRPILEETETQNREIVHQAREELRMALMEMIDELTPILEPEQLERLREFSRPPERGKGPRNGRRPGPPGILPPPR